MIKKLPQDYSFTLGEIVDINNYIKSFLAEDLYEVINYEDMLIGCVLGVIYCTKAQKE